MQQLREPRGPRCWEHDRVAAELLGARRERLGLRTEQHRAFGRHVEQALGALEIGARAVEQDVVPNARQHRQTPDGAHRPLERDDGNDRQARAIARGQLAGREQRRVSFRGTVVRHQDVFIDHVGERAYADLRACATPRPGSATCRAEPGPPQRRHLADQGSLRRLLAIGFATKESSDVDDPHDHSVAKERKQARTRLRGGCDCQPRTTSGGRMQVREPDIDLLLQYASSSSQKGSSLLAALLAEQRSAVHGSAFVRVRRRRGQ